jgi:hypothetical protein
MRMFAPMPRRWPRWKRISDIVATAIGVPG